MFLSFDFSFKDLHQQEGVKRLDDMFLTYLREVQADLAGRLLQARTCSPEALEESSLLLELAPHVEDFLIEFFCIQEEAARLQESSYALAPLYRCKRLFVQRQAAKVYTEEEARSFDKALLKAQLEKKIGQGFSELEFATCVLEEMAQQTPDSEFLEIAKQYAAVSMCEKNPSVLFRLPRKIQPQILGELSPMQRKGFDCTDPGITIREALDEANYCILCHNQGKDSCSKGLNAEKKGCPLDQKISEMNTLSRQGLWVGALSVVMIDNPMVAGTGHRICNDCMKACIFQKQDPVNIPKLETQILNTVLDLPWGVEIYSLLSRWNPLHFKSPYPKPPSGYKVLVSGMGPAGFTLSHYLLNEGHQVVGIDGLKIEPLSEEILTQPIRDWSALKEKLSERMPSGFGGVAEYGITVRWDKNYLKLIRLLLERRTHFSLFDSVRLGGNLTLPQAFERGFDHVALCHGAGKPNTLGIAKELSRGVRTASDFLMSLQLGGAYLEETLTNLQIRLPIVVVGGGLTAVDTATEALAYYPVQVERFLKRFEEVGHLPENLSDEERSIAQEFLDHAKALRARDRECLKDAATIAYRKKMVDAPSYKLNPEELKLALEQGVIFKEETNLQEIKCDSFGHVESLLLKQGDEEVEVSCRTLLIAAGTHPNKTLELEDSKLKVEGEGVLIHYAGDEKVSYFGDMNPAFHGNVVKAMASAKHGAPHISQQLLKHPPQKPLPKDLKALFGAVVEEVNRLTPSIVEVVLKAPLAARNFKPGQFVRLQTYGANPIEGLALTGAHADPEAGLLSLIILEMGASSNQCQHLKKGERVSLMGPTGTPTEIPQNQTVLLVGGGLGNAVLFSIGRALKDVGNKVIYCAGYKSPQDRFKKEEIEAVADRVIWCSQTAPGFKPERPQDMACVGTVLDGLVAYAKQEGLKDVDLLLTIGSDQMMKAVACARKTLLEPYLNPEHRAIGSINSPMQCMMKEICGQCLQSHVDPETGKETYVFSCVSQDQSLDHVDFEVLQGRLKQNSLLEKQTREWVEHVRENK